MSVVVPYEGRLVVTGDDPLIGSTGVLIVATRGEQGPGEVLVKVRGGSEAFIAWSSEPIVRGSTVLVINDRGTRNVDVIPWTDPLDPLTDTAI
jgi:hypothetical protein